MSTSARQPVQQLLAAVSRGDREAAADLLPLIYDALRELARTKLAKLPPGQTLQSTALVHEAYLKIVGRVDPGWDHRGHFFAAAAQAMREILVDQARRKAAFKHGGGAKRIDLGADEAAIEPPSDDVLAVHEALQRLENEYPRKSQVINLRYFSGFTNEETAAILSVSVGTIEREWRYIRAWLKKELRHG